MMIRQEIQREDLFIPSSEDFVSMIGFDVQFDNDTHTECYSFSDNESRLSRIWVGTVDRTFSMSIAVSGDEVVRLYNDNLRCIELDEGRNLVIIVLGKVGAAQQIDVTVWPRLSISMSGYR